MKTFFNILNIISYFMKCMAMYVVLLSLTLSAFYKSMEICKYSFVEGPISYVLILCAFVIVYWTITTKIKDKLIDPPQID